MLILKQWELKTIPSYNDIIFFSPKNEQKSLKDIYFVVIFQKKLEIVLGIQIIKINENQITKNVKFESKLHFLYSKSNVRKKS